VINNWELQGIKPFRFWAVASIVLVLAGCDRSKSNDIIINPGPKLPAAGGTLPSLASSDKSFNDIHFAGSAVCATCHSNDQNIPLEERVMSVNTTAGFKKDVSIGVAWETSTMANAARDPYWHAVVANELALYPNLESDINDKCTVCHAPMANTLAKKQGNGVDYQIFSSGSNTGLLDMDDSNPLFNHAMDGVSCSLCHQIQDVGLGTPESMTGGYTIPTATEATKSERPAYGQYGDPDVVYMKTNGEFTPVFGAHISTSEACATCHNLNIEPVDKNGQPSSSVAHFAEQAMYTEWLASDYAVGKPKEASCQSCHMPKLDRDVFIATSNASNERSDFAEHTFLAANTVMQQIMHDNKSSLGIDDHIDFLPSIERFDVKVTNLTGHKLPSGYHSRRAYLYVLITDAKGATVYENGRMEKDGGIAGVDEDVNSNMWEAHHNVITKATDVQVYQAITGNDKNERTHSLLNSAKFLKDNRLTPAGFNKNAVSADIAVAGAAENDENFNLGVDTVTYQAKLNGGSAPFNVVVEFRYQPISKGHLDDLFSRSDEIASIDHFRTMYESTPFKDEVMAVDAVTVP